MNRNFGFFIILILGLNIIGALWLLNNVRQARHTQDDKIQAQEQNIQDLRQKVLSLEDSLRFGTNAAAAPDFFPFAQTVWFKNKLFDILILDTRTSSIELFLDDEKGAPLLSFSRLKDLLDGRQKQLLFAVNAGMYMSDYQSVGLFVSKGEIRKNLDLSNGNGNFYLKPNGVFYLKNDGQAGIINSESFSEAPEELHLATQSGPLLLEGGAIHPAFNEGSSNLNVRNGVGVISSHLIVFAISRQEVNFFDFAQFFRDRLGCEDALYLDGVISKMYAPPLGRNDLGGQLGPMIAVFKDKALRE